MAEPDRIRIVIVGGGYAGTRVARALDDVADIVLIERRDSFVHNIAAMRAITDPVWLSKMILPYDRLLDRGSVVHGDVVGVSSQGVKLADGSAIEGKYTVLAPGSSYAQPFKPQAADSGAAYSAHIMNTHGRLRAARSVAIIGGGPVGIELAGEIRTAFNDKAVTLISSSATLVPLYSRKLESKLRRQLSDLGVKLVLGQRAVNLPETKVPFGPGSVLLQNGSAVDADLIIPALGAVPNTAFLAGHSDISLERGRIVVDEHLQLPAMPNVFALGDAALTADTMTASALERQVPYVSKMLRALVKGGSLRSVGAYKPWPQPVIVVPLGPEGGASQLPASLVFGPWLTSLLKGRYLLTDKAAKGMGRDPKAPGDDSLPWNVRAPGKQDSAGDRAQ